MSTEHPLTEEQLDALVDELQDRLGDSTARKYGRRGVLAALGVAALGTGSASGQASGSVGTASSPVDVEGYDVTASNSFTDPAGVQHTGELADLSDVGTSGQWQETNSGANIEPIDGETIGTGSEDVDVGSVSTESITTVTINVPSDYATLPDAVDEANKIYRRRGFEVVINIESGYSVANDLFFNRGFFGHITIQSADATVPVDSSWTDTDPLFVGRRAWLPKLDCLIDMKGLNPNADASYIASRNCIAEVGDGAGIINSGNHGFVGRSGFYWLANSNWSGAAADGIEAQQLSQVRAGGADVSGCGRDGLFVSRQATAHAEPDLNASNCRFGLRAGRAYANVEGANLSGCERAIQAERSSIVNATSANCASCTDRSVNVNGSRVTLTSANVRDAQGGIALLAKGASSVRATVADFRNPNVSNEVCRVESGSSAAFNSAEFTSFGNANVAVKIGATATVHNATVSGSAITTTDTNLSNFNTVTSDGIIFH